MPAGTSDLAERCETIFNLQAAGLKTRLAHTGTRSAVIGLSGGLDSTLALLVTVRAFDALGLPRTGVHAVSMPGFGTTARTKSNAERLAEHLGVDFRTIPIGEAVRGHFADIGASIRTSRTSRMRTPRPESARRSRSFQRARRLRCRHR